MREKEEDRLKRLKSEEEKLYSNKNIQYICGIDEAGRGPLAGPVVVGAVILPRDSAIAGVNDSKKISEKKREELYEQITKQAISYAVGIVDHEQIDNINILNATKLALTNALKDLSVKPDVILVDALTKIDTLGIPYISAIKGDANFYSIAAASIIAKVTRDRMMYEWDKVYPAYGFAKHKGYGTAFHIEAIRENGLCQIHRKTFIKDEWLPKDSI
jgi:ribonuclease HII